MILPGFPVFFPAATVFTGTISFFGSSVSTGSTITWPASVAAGDLAILFDFALNGTASAPTSVTPSGFSAIGSSLTDTTGGLGSRFNIWRKTLVGGETTLTGMTGTASSAKMLAVFRKTAGNWGAAASVNQTISNAFATPTPQTVTAGSAPLLVIAANMFGNSDGSLSPTAGGSFDDAVTDSEVFYTIYNTAPSNVTVNRGASAGGLASFYIPLGP